MRIRIVSPAPPGTQHGNRVSALRWARILRELGHRVSIAMEYDGTPCDLLVALHAKRSAPAVMGCRKQHPELPIIVALTGTDLYRDIRKYRTAQHALEAASRLVALQPLALDDLPQHLHPKVRVIYQSVEPISNHPWHPRESCQVCVIGHLRGVKDPFRAAMAARSLPAGSRIRIVQAGAAMSDEMARRARAEERRNPRYCWLGELPRLQARRLIAESHLLILSSRMEGGANVISEAIVEGTPVLASRIPGSVGLLGGDYPGYYRCGDTRGLCDLLMRAECDPRFYGELCRRCVRLRPLFRAERERAAWRRLLAEISLNQV